MPDEDDQYFDKKRFFSTTPAMSAPVFAVGMVILGFKDGWGTVIGGLAFGAVLVGILYVWHLCRLSLLRRWRRRRAADGSAGYLPRSTDQR